MRLPTWRGAWPTLPFGRPFDLPFDILAPLRRYRGRFFERRTGYFVAALVARLAADICLLPLSDPGAAHRQSMLDCGRADRLAAFAEDELRLARLVDSQQEKGEQS